MSALTNPALWTAIAGVIGAITALIVALRAHSVATQVKTQTMKTLQVASDHHTEHHASDADKAS